ncbi:MAG TPA: ATP-dependent 6-phosphofructokinase [Clostridiales bacterium]|jgi:6-phosphofructokinase 1|nr:ATP-dependent 6-phosphofructokinase [Clostridiales bacterium]
MQKIAVLTSGGDSPGMNAAVMSVARAASLMNMQLVGIKRGYNGLIGKSDNRADDICELSLDTVLDIADLPGTYLRTARCPEFLEPEYQHKAVAFLKSLDISGLVVIGGDGSLRGAQVLSRLGVPCIGIPGTIDNDLGYTDTSLGFDTAVNVCVEAVRAIRATSRSHDRPAVVEVMGRNCGDIALMTALSTGSEMVIVPEVEQWSAEDAAARLSLLLSKGNTRASVIVAEGAWKTMAPFDTYGYLKDYTHKVYPGQPMDIWLFARVLRYKTKSEVRGNVIGYTQRGHQPSARDAAFAFEAGVTAVRLLRQGQTNRVIGTRNGRVFDMDIDVALTMKPYFNRTMYNMVNAM